MSIHPCDIWEDWQLFFLPLSLWRNPVTPEGGGRQHLTFRLDKTSTVWCSSNIWLPLQTICSAASFPLARLLLLSESRLCMNKVVKITAKKIKKENWGILRHQPLQDLYEIPHKIKSYKYLVGNDEKEIYSRYSVRCNTKQLRAIWILKLTPKGGEKHKNWNKRVLLIWIPTKITKMRHVVCGSSSAGGVQKVHSANCEYHLKMCVCVLF